MRNLPDFVNFPEGYVRYGIFVMWELKHIPRQIPNDNNLSLEIEVARFASDNRT